MGATPLAFRCFGRSNRSEIHTIEISSKSLTCSCQGTSWCSHIDATLLAGERYMVPDEDHALADLAQKTVATFLKPPADWASSWREDKVWRGLAPPKSDELQRIRWEGRPTIAFIGNDPEARKADYLEHALSLGWRIVENPNTYTTLIVASDQGLRTKAGKTALAYELPIIAHFEWREWCYDFTGAIYDRIEHHGFGPSDQSRYAA